MPADHFDGFCLKCRKEELPNLARKYDYPDDDRVVERLGIQMREHGYLGKPDFLRLCQWKSPRTRPHCAANSAEFIKEVTGIALSTKSSEQLRIEVLLLLNGVGYPTASVILHFGYANLYPILDFRALWSVGAGKVEASEYCFQFWRQYADFCRKLAREVRMPMRELDRALWQYSKEKQPKK
jgi:thermostable 8-oxoguanine DNA glycosylase